MFFRFSIFLWLLPLVYPVVSAASDLERLFMSPDQRALIDQAKSQKQRVTDAVKPGSESVVFSYIAVNAVLLSDRRFSVWVNQQLLEVPKEVLGIQLDPKHVSSKGLMVISNNQRFYIKQGQAFIPSEQKVVEIYEAKRYR